MSIVSFSDYEVTPRYDGTAWTEIQISESADKTGPWNVIDTITIDPVAPDPANPLDISFTTEKATLTEGWYLVTFLDANSNELATDPVFNASPESYEILASLDDINANLDGVVVEADAQNSSLAQISVARVIKAYLSRTVDPVTMVGWATPETTPQTIREIAGKLIAAQVYFNSISKSSNLIPADSYSQVLYNEAMAMLTAIVDGTMAIDDGTGTGEQLPTTPADDFATTDFFPVDATDRAFTMSMPL
jgi:hypothetical protein